MNKVFVVGCSRSGTSLIQKRITEEFDVWSLPETEFFIKRKETIEERISLVKDLLSKINMNISEKINVGNDIQMLSWLIRNVGESLTFDYLLNNQRYSFLQDVLTKIVKERTGFTSWLEKTPTHYQHCENILSSGDADIIFVVRNGLDVAASIRDRANKYPELFQNQLNIQYSINLWNDSIKRAIALQDNSRVFIQPFSSFVENESGSLNDIAKFAKFERGRLKKAIKIKGSIEAWKDGTDNKTAPPEEKWRNLFSDEELEILNNNLALKQYRELCGALK